MARLAIGRDVKRHSVLQIGEKVTRATEVNENRIGVVWCVASAVIATIEVVQAVAIAILRTRVILFYVAGAFSVVRAVVARVATLPVAGILACAGVIAGAVAPDSPTIAARLPGARAAATNTTDALQAEIRSTVCAGGASSAEATPAACVCSTLVKASGSTPAASIAYRISAT